MQDLKENSFHSSRDPIRFPHVFSEPMSERVLIKSEYAI